MRQNVVAITLVKNEVDIIESFIRHTLTFADRILIMLHLCTDDTEKIIEKLRAEGLPIETDHYWQPGYAQSEIMTKLAQRAVFDYQADLVLPLDADEFLFNTDNHRPCVELLQELSADKIYRVYWRTYELIHPQEDQDMFLPLRPCRRESNPQGSFSKVIIGANRVRQGIIIGQGNHEVYSSTTGENIVYGALPMEDISCLHLGHFQIRSSEQAMSKYITGWLGVVAQFSLYSVCSGHHRKYYHQLAEGITPDIPFDIKQPEEIDLRKFVPNIRLKYTKPLSQDYAFSTLLFTAESLAEAYLESHVLRRKKIVTVVIPNIGGIAWLNAAVQDALQQTYPYTEIFVLSLQAEQPANAQWGEAVTVLQNSSDSDVFAQLSRHAKSDYVQWLLPHNRIHPDMIMKTVACLESQKICHPIAIANGNKLWERYMPYMNFAWSAPGEAGWLKRDFLWKTTLTRGQYIAGGLSALVCRRAVVESRHWFRDYFVDTRPCIMSLYRSLFCDITGEHDRERLIVVHENYCWEDGNISDRNWLWHQIEWGWLLLADKHKLTASDYAAAIANFGRNRELTLNIRRDMPELWHEYDVLWQNLQEQAQ